MLVVLLGLVKILVNGESEASGDTFEDALANTGMADPAGVFPSIRSLEFLSGTVLPEIPVVIEKLPSIESVTSAEDVSIESIVVCGFMGSRITSVTLPTVKTIGSSAFENCDLLSTIEFESVETIGERAFRGTNPEEVNLPHVTDLGQMAFLHSQRLRSVSIPSVVRIRPFAFNLVSTLENIEMATVEQIENMAFTSTHVTSLTLPNLIFAGVRCFSEMPELKYVSLPKLETIPPSCFSFASKLATAILPVAHSLGDSAFQYCVSLTQLDADFQEIGAYAFSCCDGFLKGLEVRWDQLVSAGDCAFEFSTMFHFSSASVEYLGNQAFQYCTNLIRVTVPNLKDAGLEVFLNCRTLIAEFMASGPNVPSHFYDTVRFQIPAFQSNATYIGEGAFRRSRGLLMATFPNVEEIAAGAFEENAELVTISLPNVRVVGDGCFRGCESLVIASLVNGTESNLSLGDESFMNCKKLREVNFSRVISVGSRCFSGMTITEFSMERLVEIRAEGFKNCFIEIARYSQIETIGDGAFSGCVKLTNLSLVNVTGIPAFMCYHCQSLVDVDVQPVSVGASAFESCGCLSHVDLSNVTRINGKCFMMCVNITEFVFPSLQSISGDQHFSGCSGLEYVSMPDLRVVSTDGSLIFENCVSLKRIDLPWVPPNEFSENVFTNTRIPMSGKVVPITLCLAYDKHYGNYQHGDDLTWKSLSSAVPRDYMKVCEGYSQESETGKGNSTAGIIVGVIVFVCLTVALGFVIWYFVYKKRVQDQISKNRELTRAVVTDFG